MVIIPAKIFQWSSTQTEREVQKSSLSKKPRVENTDDNPSVPKTMTDKEEELVIKLCKVEAQIETKTEEIKCFVIPYSRVTTISISPYIVN